MAANSAAHPAYARRIPSVGAAAADELARPDRMPDQHASAKPAGAAGLPHTRGDKLN